MPKPKQTEEQEYCALHRIFTEDGSINDCRDCQRIRNKPTPLLDTEAWEQFADGIKIYLNAYKQYILHKGDAGYDEDVAANLIALDARNIVENKESSTLQALKEKIVNKKGILGAMTAGENKRTGHSDPYLLERISALDDVLKLLDE